MLTKTFVEKQTKNASTTVSQKQYKSSHSGNTVTNRTVRTTQLTKMIELVLTDPDSITREEFILFQSAIGYSQAVRLMEEGKRRKQLQKMGLTETRMKNPMAKSVQQSLNTAKPEIMQKVDSVPVAGKQEEQPIQLKKEETKQNANEKAKASGDGIILISF